MSETPDRRSAETAGSLTLLESGCYGQRMKRPRHRAPLARALYVTAVAVGIGVTMAGCAGGERAERIRDIAALKSQLDEIRKSQEANSRTLARLSGEMKAL